MNLRQTSGAIFCLLLLMTAGAQHASSHCTRQLPSSDFTSRCADSARDLPQSHRVRKLLDFADMTPVPTRIGYVKNAYDKCTKWSRPKFTAQVIESCEWFIANGQGTVRELATAHFFLGHALSYGPRGKQAIEEWRTAAKTDPTYIEPLLAAGMWLAESKDVEAALAAFDEAERVDGNDWRVFTGKAWAWFWIGGEAAALPFAEKGARLGEHELAAHYAYGRMFEVNGRLAEAAREYELAVKNIRTEEDRGPEVSSDENPLIALARVREMSGEFGDALGALKQCEALTLRYCLATDIFREMARLEEKRGNFSAAADLLEKALASVAVDQHPAIRVHRAIDLARGGRTSEAVNLVDDVLDDANLNVILRLQVWLKNSGFDGVEIDGKPSAALKDALTQCLSHDKCAQSLGEPI